MLDFFEYSDAVQELIIWGKAYAQGNPIVLDATYDDLFKKVKLFELNNTDMIDNESPTQKVADDKVDGFPKVKHIVPMGSIANSNGIDEVSVWANATSEKGCNEQVLEYKIDGLALSLIYVGGLLTSAVTRGDGATGDLVLNNALRIASIPKMISTTTDIVEIRGEVVWLKDDFEAFNKILSDLGLEQMSNPRNGASGTMKSKDPSEVERRKLNFIAYRIARGSVNDKHSDDLKLMKEYGFTVSEHYICKTPDKVVSGAEYMRNKRHELPFLIDGVVIKVNDKEEYDRLGGTVKNPHWCTAYKFPPEEKHTRLNEIEHSYGRSGAVTPVACLNEIELALTKVRRASLHNWDMVEYFGLFPGCTVIVRKAGEIIPEIVGCVETGRTREEYERVFSTIKDPIIREKMLDDVRAENAVNVDKYVRPTHCHHCSTKLKAQTNNKGDSLVTWGCPNSFCSVKQYENIVRFVDKYAMNIYGIGEALIGSMLSTGLVQNITDLYKLNANDLLLIDGIKSKSAENFVNAIQQSRSNGLERLLIGFGITGFGRTASKLVAEKFRHLNVVLGLTESDLKEIDGVGDETATNVVNWMRDNIDLVQYFIHNGIACETSAPVKLSNALAGLTLIMTGSFDTLPRDDFKDLVTKHGGSIASSINKKVDYVVLGDGAGPAKVKKIDEVNNENAGKIKVINAEEFRKMIGE